ncbi:OadG family transporter subunit [Nitratifractor sp.]
MEIDLVGESVKFMILGMTVVFVFLYVLVQLMKLQAYLIGKYFPDPTAAPAPSAPQAPAEDEKRRVAAIIAAVAEYRKTKSSSKG